LGGLLREGLAEVFGEGVDPDGFLGEQVLIVDIEFAAAFCDPQEGPVCGLIAGSEKSWLLDEGLKEDRSVAVTRLPVVRKPSGCHGENAGGEVPASDPGEDEEACVVGDEVQTALTLLGGPTDEPVSGLSFPGGGPEPKQGNGVSGSTDEIANLVPRERLISQVVVALKVFVVEVGFLTGCDGFKLEVSEFLWRRNVDGGNRVGLLGTPKIGFAVVVPVAGGRQTQQTVFLHAEHGDATAHLLEPSVVALPGEPLADEAGKSRPGRGRVVRDQLSNVIQVRGREFPSTVTHDPCLRA